MKKAFLFIIIMSLILSLSSCGLSGEAGEYTYRTYTTALGTNWNPHTWETSGDRIIMDYLTTPLVSTLPRDTDEGTYQWSYDLAESVVDVTKEHKSDLVRFGSDLGELSLSEIDSGYVFEVTLRPGLMFEGGREITSRDFVRSMELLLDPKMKNSRANNYKTGEAAVAGALEYTAGESEFSSVGIYEVDDRTFRYVTESYIEFNYLLSSFSSSWLVEEEKYLQGSDTTGELVSTDYNTSLATTVSTGPYRIASHQDEKELVLVRNEWWYGWQTDDDGRVYSMTEVLIDGEKKEQYMSTKVVISVMDNSTAKQSFQRGELSTYTPSASEYSALRYNEGLYTSGETYTMSLFFNTDKEALLKMDRSRGNLNSVVLTSKSFRRGMSLAIDRAELTLATEGHTPEFCLLNSLYYYDIYDNPDSSYRDSEAAKRAILALYNTEYGEGTPYPTLDDAYNSLSGYNLAEAKAAFAEALEQLVAEGLYTKGDPIRIKVAYAKGAVSSDENQQVALLNRYINLAAGEVGFGKITLEPEGQIANRYSAVPNGEYAIGYGAWGGAAFYPFRNMQVYMDPDYQSLHEAACWDPTTEKLTLDVLGEPVTMTYQEWSRSMTGTGVYSRLGNSEKLAILAALEAAFLSKYYRIPLTASTVSELLSESVSYYTDRYNVMYGFGGFRLMKFAYDDAEWAEYVRSVGGRIKL